MSETNAIALLAPIPLEHLEAGFTVCQQAGKVAFGSNAWELFTNIDSLRNGLKVHVFIYASNTNTPIGIKASWQAVYTGFVDCRKITAAYEDQYRPPSTRKYPDDNRFGWPIFWEIESLAPMEEPIPIHRFRGLKKKTAFQLDFIPEGPILIQYRW